MKSASVAAIRDFLPEKMAKTNLFETPRFFCDVYCLLPGQGQRPHVHDREDKIYYVIEGEGCFRVGEEEAAFGPGTAVLAEAGLEHGVRNDTTEPLRLLVFMAPHPRLS